MDVAVLEPCEVIRCGLATMLRRIAGVESLECHGSLRELLASRKANISGLNPDVIIVTCAHDDEVADLVRSGFPASRVLELVVGTEPQDLAMSAQRCADGYLMLRDITESTLNNTLEALMRGERPMPPPVANYLLEYARSTGRFPAPSHTQPYFSPREREVIALLLEGFSNRQIAHQLGISLHSVKRHVSAVLHKANSPSRAHFVARMLRAE
ncbi:response regulator transcription factor [Actinomadura sp. KC216]|uniref:response regulator transcription factor n=1 Tax=Actinomadura sp. KC216 TaxID=2530370 RepID=UPI0014049773|nr:response regulator transcription factor [Actinomadura sp. KC216]